MVAFADQLGRIAGTVQAKTAGWMEGDALKKELAGVRDGAAELLQQLTADAPPFNSAMALRWWPEFRMSRTFSRAVSRSHVTNKVQKSQNNRSSDRNRSLITCS